MPTKPETTKIDLDSIQFLLRHPWFFLYPFLIIASLSMGIAFSVTGNYQSSAVLAFEVAGGTLIDTKFVQKKNDLVGRILLGDNIRDIIKIVWPNLNENTDSARYYKRIEALRDPKNGIVMQYDKKDPRILTISFISGTPNTCYKVVRATIDTIEKENRLSSEKELKAGLAFLKKQLEFYRNKIKHIDEDISAIKSELKEKSSELSSREKDLIYEITGGVDNKNTNAQAVSTTVQKTVKYEEMSADLNLQLLEAERKKEAIQKRLESGNFTQKSQAVQNIEDDAFIKEYSSAIAAKELEMANLLSQGYMPEHPHVTKLQREMAELKSLKSKRAEILASPEQPELSGNVKKQQEDAAKSELEDTEFIIQTLKDKIALMEKYQKGAVDQASDIKRTDISTLASRLNDLKNEKDINVTYYLDIRKQLEAAEIKNRLEKEEGGFDIRIVEAPELPVNPMPFQRIPKLLIGLILAMCAGGGLAYTVDSLDNSIKSGSQVRELLQIPVLASIDQINTIQEVKIKTIKRNMRILGLVILCVLSGIGVPFVSKMFGGK